MILDIQDGCPNDVPTMVMLLGKFYEHVYRVWSVFIKKGCGIR